MITERNVGNLLIVISLALASSLAAANENVKPNLILFSDLVVQVKHVGTMPFVLGPGIVPSQSVPNLGSPVSIGKNLYFIDQNDGIYKLKNVKKPNEIQKIFSVSEAPDGLALDNRQSILNIAPGREKNSIYVMFTSGSEPATGIPIYRMPDPLPGECCILDAPIPLNDLYRIGQIPAPWAFFGSTRTEYQVLYEYKLAENKLKKQRAIAAFETQSGPTHNGGGMLTLSDGRVLFATGDALPFGSEGRAAAQTPSEHVSKLVIIDPEDGSIEVAAQGVRNTQHLEFVLSYDPYDVVVGFGDIGGVTAEEVNYVSVQDLADTSLIENFGWGRNQDGLAREGTFYVQPGLPIAGGQPPVAGFAPSPESNFIQPQAQYGRNDPSGGIAVSGPVTSMVSFDRISAVFSDLDSGIVYATTDPVTATNVPVYRVNLINGDGVPLTSLRDLYVGERVDPRFFRFPDGSAGVLFEATGDFYRLTEVDD